MACEPDLNADKGYVALDKVSTGVAGLDEVLRGGFPKGRPTLVFGDSGTGKTVLSLSYVRACCDRGEPAVFVSLEQRPESLRRDALTLGLHLDAYQEQDLVALVGTVGIGEWDRAPNLLLERTYEAIARECLRIEAKHIVLDGLDAYVTMIDGQKNRHVEIWQLMRWLFDKGITTLITTALTRATGSGTIKNILNYNVDCSILLFHRYEGATPVRQLEVIKYRGSGFRQGPHLVHLGPNGFTLAPFPIRERPLQAEQTRFSTGSPALDQSLDGGLLRGSSVLFTGPSGSGKTTLTAMLTKSALERGEHVLRLHLEGSASAFLASMKSAGYDLAGGSDDHASNIIAILPESVDVADLLLDLSESITVLQPSLLIIDSVSACRRFGSEALAFDFATHVINLAKANNVSIICTYTPQSFNIDEFGLRLNGNMLTAVFDTIFCINHSLRALGLERQVVVFKHSASNHSRLNHRFSISDSGIEVSD